MVVVVWVAGGDRVGIRHAVNYYCVTVGMRVLGGLLDVGMW